MQRLQRNLPIIFKVIQEKRIILRQILPCKFSRNFRENLNCNYLNFVFRMFEQKKILEFKIWNNHQNFCPFLQLVLSYCFKTDRVIPSPSPIKSGQIGFSIQKDAQCTETYKKQFSDFANYIFWEMVNFVLEMLPQALFDFWLNFPNQLVIGYHLLAFWIRFANFLRILSTKSTISQKVKNRKNWKIIFS